MSGWGKASALAGVARRGGLQGTLKNQWGWAMEVVPQTGVQLGRGESPSRNSLEILKFGLTAEHTLNEDPREVLPTSTWWQYFSLPCAEQPGVPSCRAQPHTV